MEELQDVPRLDGETRKTPNFYDLLCEEANYRAALPARPELDQINRLMSNPTLYEPTRKPRFPIVLCHGLYGFSDVPLPALPYHYHYWSDLLAILRDKIGVEVYAPRVPGTATIQERAETLHRHLEAEAAIRGKEVNLMAHSMGGLDCRHLLTHIRPKTYTPVSLTTLSTPHRGSEFMTWCRDNIGVGRSRSSFRTLVNNVQDEFFSQQMTGGEDEYRQSLPYSLKSPLFSPDDPASKSKPDEKEKDKSGFSIGFPDVSNTVSSFLLSLLDSPGYSNLIPSYLENTFNPNTPDRQDIKYYSIAARAPKLGMWHPLWLPKLILDSIELKRLQNGENIPMEKRGNDALVPVESAKWGEFLGTVECDHWDLRGHSGFSKPTETKKKAGETETKKVTREELQKKDETKLEKEKEDTNWFSAGWQGVNSIIGGWIKANAETPSKAKEQEQEAKPSSSSTSSSSSKKPASSGSSQNAIAEWVLNRLPSIPSLPSMPTMSLSLDLSSFEAPDLLKRNLPWVGGGNEKEEQKLRQQARLLYGVQPVKKEKFDLERFYKSLCRRLYDEGF
ncbi:alpha/beta-hydrolase [Atractiella rhizophila]|nr:alpha/beta-hydrolase [Atractiella rhizophila]